MHKTHSGLGLIILLVVATASHTAAPHTAKWTLKEPNTSPPGVCCNAQNVYDLTIGRYIRFPKFSGSHGWQSWREIYLNDSSVWIYDLAKNRWKNMRPLPTPRLAPYRVASWDSHQQYVVVFGVKAAGPTWTVQEKKGRGTFSRGVWAPADRIAAIRSELEAERSTDAYAKRRAAEATRRERKQSGYVEDFRSAVVTFLDFAPRYTKLAERLADAVTGHATPVGSGTVARTQRIPIERRAESAVIAWLRHQTTAYENMKIPRVKGKRREVRRMLAEQSQRLLEKYRAGHEADLTCPLRQALSDTSDSPS